MVHLSEEEEKKKPLKNMGFNGWCLFCLKSELYIASVMFIENKGKKKSYRAWRV